MRHITDTTNTLDWPYITKKIWFLKEAYNNIMTHINNLITKRTVYSQGSKKFETTD